MNISNRDLEAIYTFPIPTQGSLSEVSLWKIIQNLKANQVDLKAQFMERSQEPGVRIQPFKFPSGSWLLTPSAPKCEQNFHYVRCKRLNTLYILGDFEMAYDIECMHTEIMYFFVICHHGM